MAMLWLYRCTKCNAEWALLSKRYQLGPHEWGAITYTCYSCQTFLRIARFTDGNSWRTWYQGNRQDVEKNPHLLKLAEEVGRRVASHRSFTPVAIEFGNISCPTCEELMSTKPFGHQKMKCPECHQYEGENPEPGVIHTV